MTSPPPDRAPSPAPPLFTGPFLWATLAHFAFGVGGCFGVHLSGMLQELGAGEAEIGRIVALTALTALLFAPAVGRLMDSRGRPRVIRVGGVLMCCATAGYALVTEIGPWIYALRVLDGLGATLLYAALFTYAADIVPAERRTQGLALFGVAGLLPLGICGPVGDLLIATGGYRLLYGTAFVCLLGGVGVAFTLADMRSPLEAHTAPVSLRATAAQGDLLPIWVAAFPFFLAMSGVLTFMKTFVLSTGAASVGPFFTTYACMALLMRLPLGTLPDRVGPRRMVLPALSAYAAGALSLAHVQGPAGLLLAGVLCGAGHGYGFPVLLSLTVSRARPEARGSATALFTTIDWAGHVVAPPLVGLVIERIGYATAFQTLAAALLAGVFAFYALDARPAQTAS
jgi:MFS family permease